KAASISSSSERDHNPSPSSSSRKLLRRCNMARRYPRGAGRQPSQKPVPYETPRLYWRLADPGTHPMTELEQLRQEVAELRKALAERSTPSVAGFLVDTPNLPALANNFELITDLTRFAEGLLEEKHIRKKYRFNEATWTALGTDEKFIEAVE